MSVALRVFAFDDPQKIELTVFTDKQVNEATRPVPLDANDGPIKREQWGGKAEFLLACLGNAVGLGNVWRFPYLAYKNGGGAFVMAYIIMVFVIGLPLFILEMSLGQFSALGPAHLYSNLAPLFNGVGYACIAVSVVVGVYYNMIIAWTLFYFVEAFLGQNWQYCNHSHNTDHCKTTKETNKTGSGYTSSSEEFFNNYILGKSSGIEVWGSIQWKLLVALLVAWIIVCGSLIKGIQSSGKVVYFTATFPYVILVLLFIRGVTLDGAYDGMHYFIVPEWDKITNFDVWRDASIQVFYSFSIGSGGMVTYTSYNKFHEPIMRNSLLIGIGDMLTSLFAGFVVFSMLGFMAFTLETHISKVVEGGFGLAFIAIPDGLTQMPGSVVWSSLYFFMLFLLGIDSQFAGIETITTYIFDKMRASNRKPNKPVIVTLVCLILFTCGLPFCTNAGIYLLEDVDHYSTGIPYLLIGLLEAVIVSYVYGINNFIRDLSSMTGWSPPFWLKEAFRAKVAVVAPLVISCLLAVELKDLIWPKSPLTSGSYVFPSWAKYIGWATALFPICMIPIGAIHHLFFKHKVFSFWERVKLSLKATEKYGENARLNTRPSEEAVTPGVFHVHVNDQPL